MTYLFSLYALYCWTSSLNKKIEKDLLPYLCTEIFPELNNQLDLHIQDAIYFRSNNVKLPTLF